MTVSASDISKYAQLLLQVFGLEQQFQHHPPTDPAGYLASIDQIKSLYTEIRDMSTDKQFAAADITAAHAHAIYQLDVSADPAPKPPVPPVTPVPAPSSTQYDTWLATPVPQVGDLQAAGYSQATVWTSADGNWYLVAHQGGTVGNGPDGVQADPVIHVP